MRKNNQYYIRKIHRWLGVIIGVQFALWTLGGLYFSWSDIDEIHGDHFLQDVSAPRIKWGAFSELDSSLVVSTIELRLINQQNYFWLNDSLLINTETGVLKHGVTQAEAEQIASARLLDEFHIVSSELLEEVGPHHEYRGRPLPTWAVTFDGADQQVVYISQKDGSFQRVRHKSWRLFDVLWMFHTMDYQGRDDFNNLLLRAFSVFGLLTISSGFTLFFVTWRMGRNRKKVT